MRPVWVERGVEWRLPSHLAGVQRLQRPLRAATALRHTVFQPSSALFGQVHTHIKISAWPTPFSFLLVLSLRAYGPSLAAFMCSKRPSSGRSRDFFLNEAAASSLSLLGTHPTPCVPCLKRGISKSNLIELQSSHFHGSGCLRESLGIYERAHNFLFVSFPASTLTVLYYSFMHCVRYKY